MGKRFNLLYPRAYKSRDGKEQTDWMICGVAFEARDGMGFDCYLHTMPPATVQQDGSIAVRLVARPPKDRDAEGNEVQTGAARNLNRRTQGAVGNAVQAGRAGNINQQGRGNQPDNNDMRDDEGNDDIPF